MKYRVVGSIFAMYECDCPHCDLDNTHEGDYIAINREVEAPSIVEAEWKVAEAIAEEEDWDNYGWENGMPVVTEVFVPL